MELCSSRGLMTLAGVLAVCAPAVTQPSVARGSRPHDHSTATQGVINPRYSGAAWTDRARPGARILQTAAAEALSDALPTPSGSTVLLPGSNGGGRRAAPDPVQADAYGLNLEPLATCVSCTSANAGENSSGAEGRELRVAGESVSEGQVPANGYSNGWLVAVPFNDVLGCTVAGWNGSTTANGDSSQAGARSALLGLDLGHGRLATVTVVDSASEATYSDSSSHAHSRSDGARADLGAGSLRLAVLHSEGSSDGQGDASLASVNDVQLMSSARPPTDNVIGLSGVTSVTLLHSDRSGGLVVSASDGRAQRVITVGTTWVGSPSTDPQPLR